MEWNNRRELSDTISPENLKRYNGKELFSEMDLGHYAYGARMMDPILGRFINSDPLSELAPGWTPYRYGFNNPISYTDPTGMFESKEAAKKYAKDNDINTGFWGNARIERQKDGTYEIVSTHRSGDNYYHTSTKDFGGDIGVQTGVEVKNNDVMSREVGWFSDNLTLRDGSTVSEGHKDVGFPGGAAAKAGLSMASFGGGFSKVSSSILSWGNNAKGHLIKHADVLGLGGQTAQQLQKMLPQLRAAANQLYNNVNPALTRIGTWPGQADNVLMHITNDGKMLVTKLNGEFITAIPKTSNVNYVKAIPY